MESIRKVVLLLHVFLLMIFYSCHEGEKWNCFSSANTMDSVWVDLNEYDSVWIEGPVQAFFVQTQDTCGLKIVAAKDLLDNVKFCQKGKKVHIEETSSCRWLRNLHYTPSVWIYFTSRDFYVRPDNFRDNFFVKDFRGEKLAVDYWLGRGATYVRGEADSMKFWVNAGGGSFVVRGKAGSVYVYHHGNSKLFFKQLLADTLVIDQRSNNDIFASVNKKLIVSIHYNGNVYYMGSPSSTLLKKTGSGELIHVVE